MTIRPLARKDESNTLILGEGAASIAVIRDAAVELLAMHDIAPRVVRYVASMQKWLITQAIVALHFKRENDVSCPPLTAGALIDIFAGQPVFSKNTLTAHLAEMRAYGLLVAQESRDRRVKPLQLSAYGQTLIRHWLESHLAALDRLDGGVRAARLADEPSLLARIHPMAIQSLIFDPAWACPPASVDLFVRTESGSNILHELICRLPTDLQNADEPVCLGPLHASEVSTRHTLSRGHVQRVFARARAQGLLTWGLPGNRGDLFVSPTLLWDYARWQAVKFEAISAAYQRA
ncbi:hypothetical protein IB238_22525 [Rhizobium sp. ARZ01]|uniref:hypothetical protein n=1 Tax=Rhizobium sp. ARZ01 TaxID=2769313 RepID=UPI00178146AF|nr:hypothetical protein [Rhizobium sp. ARZ01]MBD9375398.1 hypothetical protein [Rhizobium sp. ARZ01]